MTTLPLADARQRLSQLVDSAMKTHERIEVTRNGRRAVVILSAEDYDSLVETLEILSDPEVVADIRAYRDNPDDVISAEQMREEMRATGRLRP